MFSQLHDERPKISPLATNERPLSCHCFSRLSSVNSIDSIYEFIENKNEDMELSSFSDTSSSSSQSGTSHYFSIYSPIPSEISPTTPIPNRIYSSSYPFNLMSEIDLRRSSLPSSCNLQLTHRKGSLMTTVLNRYNSRHNEIDVNTDDFDEFMRNNKIIKSNYYSIDNENTDDVLMPLATSLQKTQQLQFHTNDDYNNSNNPIASNKNTITTTTITITPSISITDITHNPSIAFVSSINENNTNPLFKIKSTPLPPPSTTTTNTVSEKTTTTTITTISETITINPTPPPPPTTTTKINNLLNLNNLSTNTILITPQNQYEISETNPTSSEQNHHNSVSGIVPKSSDDEGVHNNNNNGDGGGGGGGNRGNVNSPNTTATSTASMRRQRHRHSIAGQMSYFKMLGLGGSGKKMATSANSLFSTAVISGSSSAPNLRDMIPNTASPSGTFFSLSYQQFEFKCLNMNILLQL